MISGLCVVQDLVSVVYYKRRSNSLVSSSKKLIDADKNLAIDAGAQSIEIHMLYKRSCINLAKSGVAFLGATTAFAGLSYFSK